VTRRKYQGNERETASAKTKETWNLPFNQKRRPNANQSGEEWKKWWKVKVSTKGF